MTYQSNKIANVRTIKAYRGEALKIDLGRVFPGTLTAWMKRDPNDLVYRSFEILENRYLYLSKEKASDYVEGGVVVAAIEGKWYFDVEMDPELTSQDTETIYRGTILFQNDITGSLGTEGVPPPGNQYRTIDIKSYLPMEEGFSGEAQTASDLFIEHKAEIEALKGARLESAYRFDNVLMSAPTQGYLSFDASSFESVTKIFIHKLDRDGFNNAYFIEALEADNFITLRSTATTNVAAFKVISVGSQINDVYTIDVVLESSLGSIFENDENLNIEGLVKAEGGATLTETVSVVGIGSVGALSDGDVLVEGTPYTEFVKRLVQRAFSPTAPTAGLSIIPSAIQEIGSTISFALTPSFTQNDAGTITSVVFKRNNTVIRTQADLTPYEDSNRVISAGNMTYSVEISYEDGPIFLGPGKTGQIVGGIAIGSGQIVGAYNNWFGPYGITPPTTGAQIRDLGSTFNNAFTLNTGNTALYHVIAVPATRNLVSVIDQDALNANITSSYILSETITTVPDGGGGNVSFKVYILSLATPYGTSHRHNIIIA